MAVRQPGSFLMPGCHGVYVTRHDCQKHALPFFGSDLRDWQSDRALDQMAAIRASTTSFSSFAFAPALSRSFPFGTKLRLDSLARGTTVCVSSVLFLPSAACSSELVRPHPASMCAPPSTYARASTWSS